MSYYTESMYKVLIYKTKESWESGEISDEIPSGKPNDLDKLVDKYTEKLFQQDWYKVRVITRNFRLLVAEIDNEGNTTRYIENEDTAQEYVDSMSEFLKFALDIPGSLENKPLQEKITIFLYSSSEKSLEILTETHGVEGGTRVGELYFNVSHIGKLLYNLEDIHPSRIEYRRGDKPSIQWVSNLENVEVTIYYAK